MNTHLASTNCLQPPHTAYSHPAKKKKERKKDIRLPLIKDYTTCTLVSLKFNVTVKHNIYNLIFPLRE
jgi:hypothetical protein